MQAWTKGKITVKPWQTIPGSLAELGLTPADGRWQVWFATEHGRLTGGAAAVNEALSYVWWARPFTFYYRLPGFKQLEDRAYRWVADNRHRLPGGSAQCSVNGK